MAALDLLGEQSWVCRSADIGYDEFVEVWANSDIIVTSVHDESTGGFLSLDADDGGQLTSLSAYGPPLPNATVLGEEILVSVDRDDDQWLYFALSADLSGAHWDNRVPHSPLTTAAAPICLSEDESYAFLDDETAAISCRSIETGARKWRFHFGEKDLSLGKSWLKDFELKKVHHIMSIGDAVYATVCNHLVCLDAETGEERWWVETDLKSGTAVYDTDRHRIHYVLATRLLTIDPDSGEVLADHDNSGQVEDVHVTGLATVTTDHFLCASWRAPELYALDKETGELAWKTELEDRVGAKTPPVVVDGRVYVLDLSGNLYVFESED